MTIMDTTTDQIEFLNKNGRKVISVVNETGSVQIIGMQNIERLRKYLNELKDANYNMRDPFLHKEI
ncbi:hypothetical protein D3C73_531120 [compost metagenome]